MTQQELIKRLETTCFGLDPIDPLRLLVDDVIAALAQPEQEPVAWLSTDSIGERHLCFDKPLDNDPVQPLFTSPPQRTWVGLTFAEICECENDYLHKFARAIEAKLKEKNT
jgi:hypothetical protein